MTAPLEFPALLSLDGPWDFIPGSDRHAPGETIQVPGLWEAAGYTDLDGEAWYRRTFWLDDNAGAWTLEFGAVMDEATVFVNGAEVGSHLGAFTPFVLDASSAIHLGENLLEVRVCDIERTDPRHLRNAHGKQGWMHDVFPSPPSLYMTYGGIWQPVNLRQHGSVRIADAWVNSDPGDLVVEIELDGRPDLSAEVEVALLGRTLTRLVHLRDETTVSMRLGAIAAEHWSPEAPVLHDLRVTVSVDGQISDRRQQRFGLRRVEFSPDGLVIDGRLTKIMSTLVQGFRADTLYAEGSREAIVAEVQAAKAAGLNMLRLHIKAFDPRYLDVCDELGMLVHCDIPVAEPIAHAELDFDGAVADAAAVAAYEQVRRDRNHPSIVLWSAMNELGAEALPTRKTAGYEGFARRLHETVSSTDPTRPVIENDWIEPDPDEVFHSPVLTAHWYGRLSSEYLKILSEKTRRWASGERPLFVSEFGDWGLPELSADCSEFWAYGESLTRAVGESPWTDEVEAFVKGTQHYQGVADRLQIEIFRTTPGVIGWCVTELTDVPQEFNGLLDLERNPKEPALAQLARATQTIVPIIRRTGWTALAGSPFECEVIVVNDGSPLADCRLQIRWGESQSELSIGPVESRAISTPVAVRLRAPEEPGGSSLELTVLEGTRACGENGYLVHVVGEPEPLGALELIGDDGFGHTLSCLGASFQAPAGLLVIGEGRLDAESGRVAHERLRSGGDVVVFAQGATAAGFMPCAAEMADLATEWGSTPFLFTTSAAGIAALPSHTVLTTEILEATPTAIWTTLGPDRAAVETAVGAFKPYPGQAAGTVIGRLRLQAGTLTVCQLPVTGSDAIAGALARALVGDVINYARTPLEVS